MESVLGEPGPRLMAVNADEGEPGTFKDRYYLETDPHRVLEGMLIGAHLVEAAEIYFYLRDEYPEFREILPREIAKLEAAGLLAGVQVHLRRGAGAYICGEESAMIESIEGKRGLPRHKPAASLPGRHLRPADADPQCRDAVLDPRPRRARARVVAGPGPQRPQGPARLFGVGPGAPSPASRSRPAGVTVRELIDEYCGGMLPGHAFKAYVPGGASGGILPASLGDVPLDFGTLEPHGCFIGSAAVVVLSDQDDIKEAALNLMRFFEDESCGQCTPCRVGTEKAVKLMAARGWDEPLLTELSVAMRDASICGLGQAAPNPMTLGHEVLSRRRRDRPMSAIKFTIDGVEVEAREGETIWQVAKRHDVGIPHLCYSTAPGYRPDGNCRACMVEIEGERVLAASCLRKPTPGMKVGRRHRARRGGAAHGVRAAGRRPAGARHRARSRLEVLELGRQGRRHRQPLPAGRAAAAATSAIRRWRSISTPASTAISASAPAARSRSTT